MKIRIVFFFFLILFLAIVIKLFFLQVIAPYSLNTSNRSLNIINPERGLIYDRNMLPLVINQNKYKIYVEPKKVKEKNILIKTLSELFKIDEATLEARIDDSKDWVSITSGISKEDKAKLEHYKFKGIGFEDEPQRFYPEASLSAHLLGFVGKNKDGNNLGYFGIEGYYNKDLSGLPGIINTEKDLLGRYIFIGNQKKINAENGRNLVLTIDKSIQEIAKVKLQEGLDKYQAKDGCVIIADPTNMEILAMVCLPDYDLEKYYDFSNESFTNNAISLVY
ncbi:MAG: hypothetical protein Q8P65_01195, partial [bacterium]|nr:hypothetical protein [bacterium]